MYRLLGLGYLGEVFARLPATSPVMTLRVRVARYMLLSVRPRRAPSRRAARQRRRGRTGRVVDTVVRLTL